MKKKPDFAIDVLKAIASGKHVSMIPKTADELLAYIEELEEQAAQERILADRKDERIAVLSAACGAAETAR